MEIEYIEVEGGCQVTAKSPFNSKKSSMFLPISGERLIQIMNRDGRIQDVAPELDADQREFLITGIPPEQWPTEE